MSKVWWYPAAPAAALLGSVLTWAAGAVWGDNIGLGACSYRLPYSPYGPAFSIWSLIYLWSDVGCVLQLFPEWHTGKPEVNLCGAMLEPVRPLDYALQPALPCGHHRLGRGHCLRCRCRHYRRRPGSGGVE